MSQGNLPLNENDRRNLTASQLLDLAKNYEVVLTDVEQKKLTGSYLLELAKLGQELTQESRNRLTNSQKIDLQRILQGNSFLMSEANQKPVFVSHASEDEFLVERFVDLLITGVGLRLSDIFCTSLEGAIPAGEDFIGFIKQQIQSPKFVLMLITENYLDSRFCLCEMGASWAMSHRGIPIIVEPVQFADLDGVLTAKQALRLSDPSDLSVLRDTINEELRVSGISTAHWEKKRDGFIEWLASLSSPAEPLGEIAEPPAPSVEMTGNPTMDLAGRIGKVIQFIERRIGNADAKISSDAVRRLFRDAHQLLTTIYAEIPDGLRSSTLRECINLVENVYTTRPFESAYESAKKVARAVERLKEFHEYLTVGI